MLGYFFEFVVLKQNTFDSVLSKSVVDSRRLLFFYFGFNWHFFNVFGIILDTEVDLEFDASLIAEDWYPPRHYSDDQAEPKVPL